MAILPNAVAVRAIGASTSCEARRSGGCRRGWCRGRCRGSVSGVPFEPRGSWPSLPTHVTRRGCGSRCLRLLALAVGRHELGDDTRRCPRAPVGRAVGRSRPSSARAFHQPIHGRRWAATSTPIGTAAHIEPNQALAPRQGLQLSTGTTPNAFAFDVSPRRSGIAPSARLPSSAPSRRARWQWEGGRRDLRRRRAPASNSRKLA